MAHRDEVAVGQGGEAVVVALSAGQLGHVAAEVDGEDGLHAVFIGEEEERAAFGVPGDGVGGVVPVGGEVGLGARGDVEHHDAVLVALIAVALHAEPCQA